MTQKPHAQFFAWIAPDSSRVLGLGLSPQTAFDDARRRHTDSRGYSTMLTLTEFPPNANPAIALTATLWSGCQPTATELGAADVPEPFAPPKEEKSEPRIKAVNGEKKAPELKLKAEG